MPMSEWLRSIATRESCHELVTERQRCEPTEGSPRPDRPPATVCLVAIRRLDRQGRGVPSRPSRPHAGCGSAACPIARMRSRVRSSRADRSFSRREQVAEDFFHGQQRRRRQGLPRARQGARLRRDHGRRHRRRLAGGGGSGHGGDRPQRSPPDPALPRQPTNDIDETHVAGGAGSGGLTSSREDHATPCWRLRSSRGRSRQRPLFTLPCCSPRSRRR